RRGSSSSAPVPCRSERVPAMRSCTPSLVALALFAGGSLVGCSDASPPDDGGELHGASSSSDGGSDDETLEGNSSGETDAPPTTDPCADACLDLATPEGGALCHSCRCKIALDDWLPSTDELQCS